MQDTLTRSQLNQIVEEYTKLRDWVIVRDFCNQVYGEGVVNSLTLETYGEYNDEGGTDYSVESIYPEPEVDYDLSLPFWKYLLARNEGSHPGSFDDDAQEWAKELLGDWYGELKDKSLIESNHWVQWDELPTSESNDYDLTQQPIITFPVFMPE